MNEEYTVELYDGTPANKWVKQCMVGSFEECEKFIENNPVKEPYYYSIWCIEYDDDGEEMGSFPVY